MIRVNKARARLQISFWLRCESSSKKKRSSSRSAFHNSTQRSSFQMKPVGRKQLNWA